MNEASAIAILHCIRVRRKLGISAASTFRSDPEFGPQCEEMPRYYCDYCDTYLTHDSPSVRKQHNAGYKHKANVRSYYQQYEAQLNQSLIDQKVKEHLGAFRPPIAPYPQLRPGMQVLPMPVPGQYPPGAPMVHGMRSPMLPMPMPGYGLSPNMQQMVPPLGAPPGMNGLPRPLTALPPPPSIPGGIGIPASGAPPMFSPSPYQGAVALPSSGGSDATNINAQSSEPDQ